MMRKVLATLSIVFLSVVVPACLYTLFFESPQPEWDTSPETLIIGVAPYKEIDYNYIPDFRVWGDGRIIWVEHGTDGSRTVFQGYLTQEDMKELVADFIEVDFFKRYRRLFEKDYAFDHITIHLSEEKHSELIDAKNTEIYKLITYLRQGAGAERMEFIPKSGTLYVIELDKTDLPQDIIPQHVWPAERFGYSLSAGLVREISSDDLLFAWEIVNSKHPIVESNSEYFWIAVMIPGVTFGDG